jgi:hypothetical protein
MDVIAFGPQRQIGYSPEDISIRIDFEARFKNLRKLVGSIYARVAELILILKRNPDAPLRAKSLRFHRLLLSDKVLR